MTQEKLMPIKITNITNNCPECFGADLKLTFYQKYVFKRFSKRITNEISNEIKCNLCDTIIYPVQWTNDLELVMNYYQKAVEPKKASVKYTSLFYILISIPMVIFGILGYLFYTGYISL